MKRVFATFSIILLSSFLSTPCASAEGSSEDLEIIKVEVGGPVVRLRFELPSSCWQWEAIQERDSKANTRIVVRIVATFVDNYAYCPKDPVSASYIVELPNDVTELADKSGRILYSRPGTADFKLIAKKSGQRAIKAYVIYEKKPNPFIFEYELNCNNGKRAKANKSRSKDTVLFSNLKSGSICTVSMRAVFEDSMIVKITSSPLKV